MKSPPRYLEDPSAPARLRSLLASAAPTGAPPRADLPGPPPPKPMVLASPGAAFVGAVAAVVVGGALLWPRSEVPRLPEVQPSVVLPAEPAEEAPPAVDEPIGAPPDLADKPEETRAPSPARPSRKRRTSKPTELAPPEPPPSPPLDPFELLIRARRALDEDPRGALELVELHTTRFPRSNLAQERALIAIEALQRVGDTPAADERKRRFLRDYPDSPYRSRLE